MPIISNYQYGIKCRGESWGIGYLAFFIVMVFVNMQVVTSKAQAATIDNHQDAADTIIYDQNAGTFSLPHIVGYKYGYYGKSQLQLVSSNDVKIIIKNTNTAFFKYADTSKQIDSTANQKAAAALLPKLVSFGAEVVNIGIAGTMPSLEQTDAISEYFKNNENYSLTFRHNVDFNLTNIKTNYLKIENDAKQVENSLRLVDTSLQKISDLLYYAPDTSLEAIKLHCVDAIHNMSPSTFDLKTQQAILQGKLKTAFTASTTPNNDDPVRFNLPANLSNEFQNLRKLLRTARNYVHQFKQEIDLESLNAQFESINTDDNTVKNWLASLKVAGDELVKVNTVLADADTILVHAPNIICSTTATGDIASSLLQAKSSDTITIPKNQLGDGKVLTVNIKKSKVAEFGGLDLKEPSFEVTVRPDRLVRAEIGVGYLGWGGPHFSKFNTVQKSSGIGYTIVASGDNQPRMGAATALSFTYRGMDWRDIDNNGWAVWLPELVAVPIGDFKGFGAGIGLSYDMFRASGGLFWVENTILDDSQTVGQELQSADELKTNVTFNQRYYFSLSFSVSPHIF